jgi:hypothetical protein
MGGRQQPRAEAMGGGPTLVGGEVLMPAADRHTATSAPSDTDAEEPHAGPDDLREVDDRRLLDAVLGQLAAALRTGRLGDRDVDRRLGELLVRGGLATLE